MCMSSLPLETREWTMSSMCSCLPTIFFSEFPKKKMLRSRITGIVGSCHSSMDACTTRPYGVPATVATQPPLAPHTQEVEYSM